MTTTEQSSRPEITQSRDEATRYLCAAAHQDQNFCDNAIREFLTESLRVIPPSTAVNAGAVLREAVAARARRQIRDWTLLAILLAFAISNIVLALLWLVTALVVRWPVLAREHATARRYLPWIWLGAALLALGFLPTALAELLATGTALPALTLGPAEVVLGLAAIAVVAAEEFVLWCLLTKSFRRGSFTPAPAVDRWPGERLVRRLGRERYTADLRRVAEADRNANLVAYRGYEPFVGAGIRHRPFSMTVMLEPAEDSEEHAAGTNGQARAGELPLPRGFALSELYDAISAELRTLRHSPSLAPSDRLSGLTERAEVIAPAEELLANLGDPAAREVLASLDQPPNQVLPPRRMAELAEAPLEWLRYYRVFEVEAWNRDITVSVYLHLGMNERTLYLEWTPCVLLPVREGYRTVDQLPAGPGRPIQASLLGAVQLPAALIGRLGGLCTSIQPLPDTPGMMLPAKYGASCSLRELAASTDVLNYFQLADVERYLRLLRRRLFRAVGMFLEERDLSVVEFMRQAQEVVANNTYIAGDVHNSAVGSNNRVSGNRIRKG
ncbi:hypothetical protein [Amycolatopsis aidingensis]|uniref:hypothetical protein n=1 Tax=Amycolatopsis aidingensis TaxID=2842453 RepID=UPI001C0D96AE|nr:hypothetical protein [Amycolatopsis aidingensis]